MKAAVVVGHNDIQYLEIQEPQIKLGQVKVAVKYCGICGSDIPRVIKGSCHSFPQVLGHEFSGIVIEKADDVTAVDIGDYVVGVPLVPCMTCGDCRNGNFSLCKHYSFIGSRQPGAMSENVVVPESNVFKFDKRISFRQAALFEPSTVALHGILLTNFSPKNEDNVCVIGAGTIGLFTIQWCKILGAKNITVIIRNKDRESIALKYGATHVISTLDEGYLEMAKQITDGLGFKYVFDAVGSSSTIISALQIAANKARICYIGTPTAPIEFPASIWELINRKEAVLTGSWMSYSSPWPGYEWQKTAECVSSGELQIGDDMIFRTYNLCKIKEAFSFIENHPKEIKGRVMVEIKQ